jgi:hypothetical protein
MDKIAQRNNQDIYTSSSYNSPVLPSKQKIGDLFEQIGIISGTISALFTIIILYSIVRMFMIQKHEQDHIDHEIHNYQHAMDNAAKNPRWELIENLVTSTSEADWRVAIIEADVLMEEALEYGGFTGSGVGEMLTNANEKSFRTYQFAWDAHKVRNDIAHEGSNYSLAKEDVIRTIGMYRAVLEEFGVI